jgi:beta-glucanase (GH16 family)
MKHRYFQLFALIVISFQTSFAQQTPIDFSVSSHTFASWGGSTFIILPGPIDSNNATGQFFKSSSPLEQGNYIDLSRPIDLDVEDKITLRFYSYDSNPHNIVVKLESGTNSNVEVVVLAPSNQNVWSDLTFDFSTVGGSGQYSRLVIRIDDGSTIPGAFRIDDINDGSVATNPNAIDVEYTDLVWSDEFNVNGAVNSTKWFHQTQLPAGGNWFNGEVQHYTNRIDNSYVDNNDYLNIVAKRENFTDQGIQKDFTSARLNSKFAFTYGRVDVRAKLPSGDGTWPAIWTLGKNVDEDGGYWDSSHGTTSWPACGEIDIMEHGLGAVNHTSSAIHTPSSFGGTINTASQVISDVTNNWHIYSMNWSPNQITFLVDGVGYYTYNPSVKNDSTWPFYKDQYLLLNVALGGIAGDIADSFTQSSMIIDYVRVYQNTTLSTTEISSNSFRVYPNPASSEINIQSNVQISHIELYDILGKLILDETKSPKTMKINNLKSGLYLLKIYAGNTKTVKKVIIN